MEEANGLQEDITINAADISDPVDPNELEEALEHVDHGRRLREFTPEKSPERKRPKRDYSDRYGLDTSKAQACRQASQADCKPGSFQIESDETLCRASICYMMRPHQLHPTR